MKFYKKHVLKDYKQLINIQIKISLKKSLSYSGNKSKKQIAISSLSFYNGREILPAK